MTIGIQNLTNRLIVYQADCLKTATYPGHEASFHCDGVRNPAYLGLKLVGEAQEYEATDLDTFSSPYDIKAELGDCCWYAAMLCNEFGWSFAEMLSNGRQLLQKEDEYADSLLWFAAPIAESLGKLWRDGGDKALRGLHLRSLRNSLAKFIALLERFSNDSMDSNFLEVLEINQEKLNRRLAEGKLNGSGSDR